MIFPKELTDALTSVFPIEQWKLLTLGSEFTIYTEKGDIEYTLRWNRHTSGEEVEVRDKGILDATAVVIIWNFREMSKAFYIATEMLKIRRELNEWNCSFHPGWEDEEEDDYQMPFG